MIINITITDQGGMEPVHDVTLDEETTKLWKEYLDVRGTQLVEQADMTSGERVVHNIKEIVGNTISHIQRNDLIQLLQQGRLTADQVRVIHDLVNEE